MAIQFSRFLGIDTRPVSHIERIASAVGGFVSILGVLAVSQWFVGTASAGIVVASMGASAVLLFAVPHGQLSQPWSVFGGHLCSAIIGVSCAQFIPHELVAASVAVGLAIGAMYYLRCIHPPGGATALSAVIGGEAIHNLGYQFVLTPVLLNVGIILGIAVLYNAFFSWRKYPSSFYKRPQDPVAQTPAAPSDTISHADFVYALSEMDSFVDVSEYDLLRIYNTATKKSKTRQLDLHKIILGNYYSNGEFGDGWSVR